LSHSNMARRLITKEEPVITEPTSPLKAVGSLVGKTAEFLFPRTTKMVMERKFEPREFVGAAGEILPWAITPFIPEVGAVKGAPLLERLGALGTAGAAMGAIHGATTPEKISPTERIKRTGEEALTGAITGAVLERVPGAISGIAEKTGAFGSWLTRRLIKPVTGQAPGWAEREAKATQEILDKTKGVTPEQVDKSIVNMLSDTTDKIIKRLSKIKEPLRVRAKGGIEDQLNEAVKRNVLGYSPLDTEVSNVQAQLMDIILRHAQEDISGDFLLSPENAFRAKQAIGKILSKRGSVFDKLEAGQPLTKGEQTGLVIYDTLKDIIDNTSPGISKLTEMEHRLYQAAEGIYKWGHLHRYPGLWNLRALPIANILLDVLGTGQMALGRGAYELGKKGAGIVESPIVKGAIKSLLGTEVAHMP